MKPRTSAPEASGGLSSRSTRGCPDKRAAILGVNAFLARRKFGAFAGVFQARNGLAAIND